MKETAFTFVYLDVDSTLLTSRQEIGSLTQQALLLLRDSGIQLGLATGRTLASALPYVRQIGAEAPLILYNGAQVVDPNTHQILYGRTLAREDALMALEFVKGWDIHVNLYLGNSLYVEMITERAGASMKKDGIMAQAVGDLVLFVRSRFDPVIKLLLIGEPDELDRLSSEYDSLCPRPARVRSEVDYLEILPPGVSKGSALAFILDHLVIPRHQVVAFGDGLNDIEMIELAGVGVAMGNAHPALKQVADMVTLDNDSEGVAYALAQLFALDLSQD